MNIYIVIPAHNEEDCIALMLESLANQTLLPKKVVVVNDNSTDDTEKIISDFTNNYSWITSRNTNSSTSHIPGSKVVNAFYKGFETLDDDWIDDKNNTHVNFQYCFFCCWLCCKCVSRTKTKYGYGS